jgi:hypothetical protein
MYYADVQEAQLGDRQKGVGHLKRMRYCGELCNGTRVKTGKKLVSFHDLSMVGSFSPCLLHVICSDLVRLLSFSLEHCHCGHSWKNVL